MYFIGTPGGMEQALVAQSGLAFAGCYEVCAGPIHGVSPPRLLMSIVKLAIGSLQAFARLLSIRPQAILLTGGWANLPVALAARLLGIPIVLYLPDIEPALTIRVLQPFAAKIAITAAPSARYFPPEKTVLTGYPLQENRLCATRGAGLARFGLDSSRKTLLVFGGSRGARSINMALADSLAKLLADGLQIIHITGELDWERAQRQVGDLKDHPDYHACPYLHEDMGLAFAAADLAVCRAGASTLAELPLFGLASILVPYPHAWHYQKVNADYLSERGAALRLDDECLSASLYATIRRLISDAEGLAKMQARAKALANPDGAKRLAAVLTEIGGG